MYTPNQDLMGETIGHLTSTKVNINFNLISFILLSKTTLSQFVYFSTREGTKINIKVHKKPY